jgi:hypothetical protein
VPNATHLRLIISSLAMNVDGAVSDIDPHLLGSFWSGLEAECESKRFEKANRIRDAR